MAENIQLPGKKKMTQQGRYFLAQWLVNRCHLTPRTHTRNSWSRSRTTPEPKAGRIQVPVCKSSLGTHRRLWQQHLFSQLVAGLVPWRPGKAKLLPIGELIKDIPSPLNLHWPICLCLCHLFSREMSDWPPLARGTAALPVPWKLVHAWQPFSF